MPETKRQGGKQLLLQLFIPSCWPFQPRGFCSLVGMPTPCWRGGTDWERFTHFPGLEPELSLKLGNGDGTKKGQDTFWSFVFSREKVAEGCMAILGLATSSSSLCLVLAGQVSHSCHHIQQGPGHWRAGTSKAPCLCGRSGGDTWGRLEMLPHTNFKALLWGFQLPARSSPPKGGPTKCASAVPSSCPFYPSSVSLGARPAATCGSCSLLQPSGP